MKNALAPIVLSLALSVAGHAQSILPTGAFTAEIVVFNDLSERGDILSTSSIAYDPENLTGSVAMNDKGVVAINSTPTFSWEITEADEDDVAFVFSWRADEAILAPGTLLNGRPITSMAFEFGGTDKFEAQGFNLVWGKGSTLFDAFQNTFSGNTILIEGEQLGGYANWSLGGADITQAEWIGADIFVGYNVVPEPATLTALVLGLAAVARRKRTGVRS